MGKKYIIELCEKPMKNENGEDIWRAKGFHTLVFDKNGLDKLEEYDGKKAYELGYVAGFIGCAIVAGEKEIKPGCVYKENETGKEYVLIETEAKDYFLLAGKKEKGKANLFKNVSKEALCKYYTKTNEEVDWFK